MTSDQKQNSGTHEVSATPLLRLGIGVFLAMNIMVFSYFFYAPEVFGQAAAQGPGYDAIAGLLAYLLMFCCTGVLITLGIPLVIDTLQTLRNHPWRINANTLILMGVCAAFVLSVINTLRGHYQLYYDTTALILVLVTLGQYLDGCAKVRATRQSREALGTLADEVWIRQDDKIVKLPTNRLERDQVVRVQPGEMFPADGIVVQGQSQVSNATLTGETAPRPVHVADEVLAGAHNIDGLLWVRVTRVGGDCTASRLEQLLQTARLHQPPIQAMADRLAAVFVPLVLLLAVSVLGWHLWRGQPQRALFDALSVLLISCPCALGLATPLATWCAMAASAKRGILFDSGLTLERASRVRQLFFDKTGTLTNPQMVLLATQTRPGLTTDQAITIAASLELICPHPIAAAFARQAAKRQLQLASPVDGQLIGGVGLSGVLRGERYHLGNATGLRWPDPFDPPHEDQLAIYLWDQHQILARFMLGEVLRPDAKAALEKLRQMKLQMRILTGDTQARATTVGQQLGVEAQGGLLPDQKLDQLHQAAQSLTQGTLGMVGDGINDAPALGAADVGIAMAGASDLAGSAGNIRLLADRLTHVPAALAIGRRAMSKIKLSLAWAFMYNLVGLTLAAMGLLTPVFAALAMAASSLLVLRTAQGAGCIDDLFIEKKMSDA